MSYYILAFAFSVASKILELLPIVPQKKCVPQDILGFFFNSTGTFIQDFRVAGKFVEEIGAGITRATRDKREKSHLFQSIE